MAGSTRILVVGGGIVAASVAYHLAREDASVITVEADLPGTATRAGAGIVCPWVDELTEARYQLAADGARYYQDLVAMLTEDGEDDIGYAKVGTFCVADDIAPLETIETLVRSRRSARPEIGDVHFVGPGEPKRAFPPLAPGLRGLWIGGGARVTGNSVRDALLQAAERHGARRMRGTAVLDPPGVIVDGKHVLADVVVVAAGAWTAEICAPLDISLPIGPQRGQIIHVGLPAVYTDAWPVILPPGDPYLLGFPGGRIVFGATRENAGFDYRTTVGGVGGMLAAAAQIAPGLADATLLETRIGFRPVTADGCPLLGAVTDDVFVAAGNGPEGLTAGPWMGRLAAELVLGTKPAADIAPFDPARFS
ncbi:MAG TPA: FAD-dependent oxidoreductase [Streptosporangiaceae bacterium]|nr:FAD-dependent oxidoreductase [Streptosporangiaceae bacterium]